MLLGFGFWEILHIIPYFGSQSQRLISQEINSLLKANSLTLNFNTLKQLCSIKKIFNFSGFGRPVIAMHIYWQIRIVVRNLLQSKLHIYPQVIRFWSKECWGSWRKNTVSHTHIIQPRWDKHINGQTSSLPILWEIITHNSSSLSSHTFNLSFSYTLSLYIHLPHSLKI